MSLWTRVRGKAPATASHRPAAAEQASAEPAADQNAEVPGDHAGDPTGNPTGPGPLSVAGWLQGRPDEAMVQDLLRGVIDPEIGVNIVDLGLVYSVRVSSDGVACVRMTLTTPGCPLSAYMDDAVRGALWGAPGVGDVDLQIVWDPPWTTDMMSRRAKQELGWER